MKLFDLQLFGKEITSANTATFGKRLTETNVHPYYDMTLKDALYEEYTIHKYFDTITLPQNNGKKMKFRKSGKYVANGEALVEGIVPDEDTPMDTYEYEVTLGDFGGYITYTDQLDLYSIDNGESTRLQRNQGYAVGELFQGKAMNVLLSSVNRYFATPLTGSLDPTSLTTARGSLGRFNLDDLRKIKTILKRNKVKGYEGGDYVIVISPEVESDIMTLAKNTTQFTFIEIANYQQDTKPLMEGEIGKWNGFRFVVDNAIREIATVSGKHIQGCVILGKYQGEKGAKLVKLSGYGEPKSILHKPGEGGAKVDPLNMVGSIGWKCMGWGGTILYPEAVMIYECVTDAVANEDFDYVNREAFTVKYNADGTTSTTHDAFPFAVDANMLTIELSDTKKSVGRVARFVVGADAKDLLVALKADAQYIHDYADATDDVVKFYSNVTCTTEINTENAVDISDDTVIYIKKNIVE